jgi:hypothetical protein
MYTYMSMREKVSESAAGTVLYGLGELLLWGASSLNRGCKDLYVSFKRYDRK